MKIVKTGKETWRISVIRQRFFLPPKFFTIWYSKSNDYNIIMM